MKGEAMSAKKGKTDWASVIEAPGGPEMDYYDICAVMSAEAFCRRHDWYPVLPRVHYSNWAAKKLAVIDKALKKARGKKKVKLEDRRYRLRQEYLEGFMEQFRIDVAIAGAFKEILASRDKA
jgi:hypothetical protein